MATRRPPSNLAPVIAQEDGMPRRELNSRHLASGAGCNARPPLLVTRSSTICSVLPLSSAHTECAQTMPRQKYPGHRCAQDRPKVRTKLTRRNSATEPGCKHTGSKTFRVRLRRSTDKRTPPNRGRVSGAILLRRGGAPGPCPHRSAALIGIETHFRVILQRKTDPNSTRTDSPGR